MKKQEFIDLWNKTDDISSKKISNMLVEYCNDTDDEEVNYIMVVLEVLANVKEFMKQTPCKQPYTIDDAFDLLRKRVLQIFVAGLEE